MGTPSWRSRVRATLCEQVAVGLEAVALAGPVLTDGSPTVFATIGLLGLGLHSAGKWLRGR